MLDDLKKALGTFPRFALLDGPTPIQRLTRLEAVLGERAGGARLWVKRDDVMGVGGGGNKLRKLEFLLGEAAGLECDTFITTGGLQSNHARQSAAAAARAGMSCELMLGDVVARHDEDYRGNGNLLLDDLFGAVIRRLPRGADPLAHAERRAKELDAQGRRAYVVGNGGSSPLGALGYAACAAEIMDQERNLGVLFEAIVVPNGSSGTQAGLVSGLAVAGDDPRRVMGFTVLAPLEQSTATTADLACRCTNLLAHGCDIPEDAIVVDGSERGEAYGVPTSAMVDALRLMARSEGLLLDPVYSGKAFAGFLTRCRALEWQDRDVLFIMTGGMPSLFAYRAALGTCLSNADCS